MVKAKKHLGQHFLRDLDVSRRIADSLTGEGYDHVLEIGPGTGALTQFLLEKIWKLDVVELDSESVDYLEEHYPTLHNHIHGEDFLRMDLNRIAEGQLAIAGNFPYNISSQILFKVLDDKEKVPELVGMFQKEVAWRVCSGPGNKDYGILSVLLQTWYNCTYLFTVDEHAFDPPPKVKSGVIMMTRRSDPPEIADMKRYKMIIKTAFNQRRKTLRNSLKSVGVVPEEFSGKRPEQLGVEEFVRLADMI